MHASMHASIHPYIHTSIPPYIHPSYIHTYIHIHTHAYDAYIRARTHAIAYTSVGCTCAHVCACMHSGALRHMLLMCVVDARFGASSELRLRHAILHGEIYITLQYITMHELHYLALPSLTLHVTSHSNISYIARSGITLHHTASDSFRTMASQRARNLTAG